MQVAPGAGHSSEFGDHAAGMGNRVQHVAANRQVERVVRSTQFENGLVLELQPVSKPCVARARKLQMVVEDIHSKDTGSRKNFRQSRGDFAGAAASVENARLGRERVTMK